MMCMLRHVSIHGSYATGKVTKAHKELLRFAKIDEWDIPKDDGGRPLRKAAYVMPQDSESDNGDIDNDTNDESNAVKPSSDVKSDAVSLSSDKDSLRVNESLMKNYLPRVMEMTIMCLSPS